MPKTMQAYRLHAYGGPSTLTLDSDVPVPVPSASQVLVKISHTAVNPFDWKIREGYLKDAMPLPLPYTLGIDFVGTVASSSGKFKEGDRVMSFSEKLGAFAEYIVVEEDILARVPEDLSGEQAATLPIPAQTALQALHTHSSPIEKGTRILVHGASGVCGAFAVQLAKSRGAFVIGTASAKNKEYVISLGADEFIDYTSQNFEEILSDIDLVLDFVLIGGSMSTTQRSWKVLKKGGAIVSFADPALMDPKNIPEGYYGYFRETKPKAEELEGLGKMLAEGKLTSKIAKVYPRGELVEALKANQAGGGTGRMIVDFGDA